MEVKTGDIIKLKKECAFPGYTYLVIQVDVSEKFEALEIKKRRLIYKDS